MFSKPANMGAINPCPTSTNGLAPSLRNLPSLSGDPFDASDDFHTECTDDLPLWSPCTPSTIVTLDEIALSSPPLTPLSSLSNTTDTSFVRLHSNSSSTPSSIRPRIPTAVAIAALTKTFEQLHSSKSRLCVPTHILRPALQTLRHVLAYVRASDLDNMTSIMRILTDALSIHIRSPSLSAQCCDLLATIMSIRPDFVHAISLNTIVIQARDVIAIHLSSEVRSVDAALSLIGTLALATNSVHSSRSLTAFPSSTPLSCILQNAHVLHWIIAALRQWQCVTSVQTRVLRAIATLATVDVETGFNLVMNHAIFHELVTLLSRLDDPVVIARTCETFCIFLKRSAEFRRLSVCDRVPHSIITHTKNHLACPRVSVAVASALSIYASDLETFPVLLGIAPVSFIVDTLCALRSPKASPRSVKHHVPVSCTAHRVGTKRRNDFNLSEPFSTTASITNGISIILDTLTTFARTSSTFRSSLMSRRFMNVSASAVFAHASDLSVVYSGLRLFGVLCAVEQMEKERYPRPSLLPSVLCSKFEPIIPSYVFETSISHASLALCNHPSSVAVVRLSCLSLLTACHRGFRRIILRKSPNLLTNVEQVLQTLSDHDDAVIPAGALRVLLYKK